MTYKLEYIWLDGYKPEPNLRSKTKVLSLENEPVLESLPIWNFDGSSTQQAEGSFSDCLLKPVKMVRDPQRKNGYLVLCEVLNPDMTPHVSNTRASIQDDSNMWVGFEQEYFLWENDLPLGHVKGPMKPQGEYYCGLGYKNVSGRNIVEHHLDVCLSAGLNVTGINAEVALGQWEYQVMGKGTLDACDQLWLCRFLLNRLCETYEVTVEYHPKPLQYGEWNGSGLHTNFSNKKMREIGGKDYFETIFNVFEINHSKHIENYGSSNDLRLTGNYETQSINKFSYGVSDRCASIRIPQATVNNNWKGYVEDRRPASNGDPYKIMKVISDSVNQAEANLSFQTM
jgi:glutamine synthetase